MRRPSRTELLLVSSLLLTVGVVYYSTLRPGHDWGSDFSQYITHARNLAQGRPYAETTYVVTLAEAARRMPPAYPPVFPLVLAPVYRYFGLNYQALKLPVQAMFVLALLIYYALARLRGLGMIPSAFAMGAFGLSGLILSIKDLVNSESTYLVFAGLTLLALALVEKNKWDQTRPLTAAVCVVTLMLLSYGTRAVGLALPLGFAIYEILIKRRLRLFSVLVLSGFAVGAAVYSATLYSSGSYLAEFQFLPGVYLHNLIYYLKSPASLWCDPTPSLVRWPLFAVTVTVAAAAWIRRILTNPSVDDSYVVASILPLLFHSTGSSDRYLVPVYALYFIYFMDGVVWFRNRYASQQSWLPAAACAVLAIGSAVNLHAMEKGPYAQGVEQPSFVEACQYIRAAVDPGSMIVSWNPRVLALYTDRVSVWYPHTTRYEEFSRYLDSQHAAYVLLYRQGELDTQWLAPYLRDHAERFDLVFANADFALYRISASVHADLR